MTQRSTPSTFQATNPSGLVVDAAALAATVFVIISLVITVLTGAGFGYV